MKAELEQKAKTEPPTEPARATASPAPTVREPTTIVSDRTTSGPWYGDGIGWSLAGGGVVAGAVAGVLFVSASDLDDEGDAAPTADQARAAHEKADTRRLAGTLVGIGGLGLLVAGGIKLAIHSDETAPSKTAWGIGASSRGAFVWARF